MLARAWNSDFGYSFRRSPVAVVSAADRPDPGRRGRFRAVDRPA